MRNKGIVISLAVVVVLAAIGASVLVSRGSKSSDKATTTPSQSSDNMNMSGQAASSSSAASSTPAQTSQVAIKDYAFTPGTITVKVGTKVTWTNQDDISHTVTVDSGDGPKSGLFGKGKTFSYTFNTAGTYNYHCIPHPYMKGSVVVTQ